ncbi:hypothetical protein SLA2020_000420 [Shorea laevis]
MSLSVFLLWLITIPFSICSASAPKGYFINCGSSGSQTVGNLSYIGDDSFISTGSQFSLNKSDLVPILNTLRYFPHKSARKFCYVVPVIKGAKYVVKTTYYYGGFNGGKEPPVFDQIIGGTKWSLVNTTEDYGNGMSSYYEIIVAASGKTLSVCLARNAQTASSPFISALEVVLLDDSVYNSTDFEKYALSTVARNFFGGDGAMISFPDDPYNRLWQPFKDQNPVVVSRSNVTPSDFWNNPPVKAFGNAITTSRGKTLQIQWPLFTLPATKYYIALCFQDNRALSPYSWRVFSVSVNGKSFYNGLNVTTYGVTVSGVWPLSGQVQITLTPDANSPVGPVINAGEILQLIPLGGRTVTRDVLVMEELVRSFNNTPLDWIGDPCLPVENSWTGVSCSNDKFARVISLNLTNVGLTGSLPPIINRLTALHHLWLSGNQLSGPIPDMGLLSKLETLHLENNQFTGPIPNSIGNLVNLREIFLQNNNLDGPIPEALQERSGINIQVSPGNHLSA